MMMGTPDERQAAMYAGTLSLRLCFHWANHAPHQVPLLNGEFWFVAIKTPEMADASEPSAATRQKERPCRP